MEFHMRRSAANRKRRGREEAGKCTLTMDDLERMYRKQRGRCFYSGLPMVVRRGVFWKASPERLDTTKGYVDGNVVLVCLEFNGVRQMSAQRVEKMILDGRKMDNRVEEKEVIQFWRQYKAQKYKARNKMRPSNEEVVRQHMLQNGRCAYSNVPFELHGEDNHYLPAVVSLYTGGFCLIIRALLISQYCWWTKDKIAFLRHHFLICDGQNITSSPVWRRRSARLLQKEVKDDDRRVDFQLNRATLLW